MTRKQRQNRIDNEIIVDAYDDEEINMSWYYYYADNLEFPISAVAKLKKRGGKYEQVEIQLIEINSQEHRALMFDFVLTMKGYVFPISLKNIVRVDTSEENREMLNDWLFWKGYALLQ